jgi:IS30 family transposase
MVERDEMTELLYDRRTFSKITKNSAVTKVLFISRELKRNSSQEYKLYLLHRAQQRADQRREPKPVVVNNLKTI